MKNKKLSYQFVSKTSILYVLIFLFISTLNNVISASELPKNSYITDVFCDVNQNDLPEGFGDDVVTFSQITQENISFIPRFIITPSPFNYDHKAGRAVLFSEKALNKAIEKIRIETDTTQNESSMPQFLLVKVIYDKQPPQVETVFPYLGLNDETVKKIENNFQSLEDGYLQYLSFVRKYAKTVGKVSLLEIEAAINSLNESSPKDTKKSLLEKIHLVKQLFLTKTGKNIPDNISSQTYEIINSLLSDRCGTSIKYISIMPIPYEKSHLVEVATRNPTTGQGKPLISIITNTSHRKPIITDTLSELCNIVERNYKCAKKIYCFVKDNRYWIADIEDIHFLNPEAKFTALLEMSKEGIIQEKDIIKSLSANEIVELMNDSFLNEDQLEYLGEGVAASSGIASGRVYIKGAKEHQGKISEDDYILVLENTSPEDIQLMSQSKGILTARGGISCHAAVVARGIGKTAVVGVNNLIINNDHIVLNGVTAKDGEYITIDGHSGKIYKGKGQASLSSFKMKITNLIPPAKALKKLKVFVNAETPIDVEKALENGAEGVGLCRTEHMFFEKNRLPIMQMMILASDKKTRYRYLKQLYEFQKNDFYMILKKLNGLPLTVRLLDPPLHEFLPNTPEKAGDLSQKLGMSLDEVMARINALREVNPMLGNRGCRLGITMSEIYRMQVLALFEAASKVEKEKIPFQIEIMIPFVVFDKELKIIKEDITRIALKLRSKHDIQIPYSLGAMIELPQAALNADKIAVHVDFISFGTNDLTQTMLGISRDDSSTFIPLYQEKEIIKADPFKSINETAIKEVLEIAIKRARYANKNIKIGMCGEHASDPASITEYEKMGLDYVSCAFPKIPLAIILSSKATTKPLK